MSQLPQQGYGSPQGAGGFPPAPPLSRDNPGQLIPARPGFLPGALPGRGAGTHGHRGTVRGTVPASAGMQAGNSTGLNNGLPFAMGAAMGVPAAPPPPQAEEAIQPPVAVSGEVAPPHVAAGYTPPLGVPGEVAPPPMVTGFAAAAPPQTPAVPEAVSAPPPVVAPPAVVASSDAPAPPPMVQPPMVQAAILQPAPLLQQGNVVVGSVSSAVPPMVTPVMGVASVEPPPRIDAPSVEPPPRIDAPPRVDAMLPTSSGGMAGAGNINGAAIAAPMPDGVPPSGNPHPPADGSASPWMMEKALPPPPVFKPEPALEVKQGPSVPVGKPTSKAPLIAIVALLVVAGLGFAAFHFRAQIVGESKKKTDAEEGALKVESPSSGAGKADDTSPAPTGSTRPPPQLATGLPQPPPAYPSPPRPNAIPAAAPSAKPVAKPPPTAKFDPQGI